MKIFKRTVGLIHKLSFRFGENVHMAQTKQNKSINNKTKANQELVMGTHKTKKEKKKELSNCILLLFLNLLGRAPFTQR